MRRSPWPAHAGWPWSRPRPPGRWRPWSWARGGRRWRWTASSSCRRLRIPPPHAAVALLATGDLVEAAVHTGTREGMEPLVTRMERLARWGQETWTLVVARRCRALISHRDQAERQFQAALATDGLAELPFELARTQLLYGQWLRRARRRADARPQLRRALETFERLGASPWADQARAELRASGQSARRREVSTRGQLTPQELQIARFLIAEFRTSRPLPLAVSA